MTEPLAVRMRPASLDQLLGQDHLLTPDHPFRRLVGGGAEHLGVHSGLSPVWGRPRCHIIRQHTVNTSLELGCLR